ncbi:hypothetical protein JCM19240_4700 [Vibrio maritimus]|uniref:Uncharacterized protein n=1 Tax=Vibrio maritimus TaxID=990268 RepID=A0A090U2V4_9VIBR|nr:hypothetical protein JCM19240_4700 [Vibrio maritimus]
MFCVKNQCGNHDVMVLVDVLRAIKNGAVAPFSIIKLAKLISY